MTTIRSPFDRGCPLGTGSLDAEWFPENCALSPSSVSTHVSPPSIDLKRPPEPPWLPVPA
ncbi:hypothetical protein N9L92_05565 [Saprospiraceae bacterium]|nr:hypothetical protein [Saprospiraceae bacterium]